jgi:hypothetical protein
MILGIIFLTNPKTVATWRKRATVEDLKIGPKKPRSTNLTKSGVPITPWWRISTAAHLRSGSVCGR